MEKTISSHARPTQLAAFRTSDGHAALVSVIVPARNAERFLSATIASACAQTYSNIEILVIDDRSTDRTAQIAHSWSLRDRRVRVIVSKGAGVSAARNTGIAHARGSLIATLDSDDLWHPDKLAKQAALLNEMPATYGLVYCWSAAIDEHDNVLTPSWAQSEAEGDTLLPLVVRFSPPGNGSTPLMRRALVDLIGGYDERLALAEDTKLYIAMAAKCSFAVVRAPLTGYRLTHTNTSLGYHDMEHAIDDVTSWIKESWPSLPDEVMRDRAAYMSAYLAILAIRRRRFLDAITYHVRSVRAHPPAFWRRDTLNFWGMWLSHRIGLNFYDWRFWRPRAPFLPPTTTRAVDQTADRSMHP